METQIIRINETRNMNDIMNSLSFISHLEDLYNSITEIVPVIPVLRRQSADIIENKCYLCNLDNIFNENLCCKCILKSNNPQLIYNLHDNEIFIQNYHSFIENIRSNYQNFFEQYPNILENNIPYYNYLYLFFYIFNIDFDFYYDIFNNPNIINFICQ